MEGDVDDFSFNAAVDNNTDEWIPQSGVFDGNGFFSDLILPVETGPITIQSYSLTFLFSTSALFDMDYFRVWYDNQLVLEITGLEVGSFETGAAVAMSVDLLSELPDLVLQNLENNLRTGSHSFGISFENVVSGSENFGNCSGCPVNFDFISASLTYEASTVPLPPAVWLFGSGLIGLIGIARRKIRA